MAIRAISDTVDFNMPYNFENSQTGEVRFGSAALSCKYCASLPACRRCLHWRATAATASRHLANFLDIFTSNLSDRLIPTEQDAMAAQ